MWNNIIIMSNSIGWNIKTMKRGDKFGISYSRTSKCIKKGYFLQQIWMYAKNQDNLLVVSACKSRETEKFRLNI